MIFAVPVVRFVVPRYDDPGNATIDVTFDHGAVASVIVTVPGSTGIGALQRPTDTLAE